MPAKGVVDIKGKSYKLIVARVQEFNDKHPDWGMQSEVIFHDAERVIVRVTITDPEGRIMGSGLAEEDRGASRINATSAMENCETSAFGRALASIGLGGDVAYASAEEVVNAINTQGQQEVDQALLDHANAVRENLDEIHMMKTAMTEQDYTTAAGIYMDFDEETMTALRRAPSKGGVWTTEEVALLRADGAVGKCVSTIKKQDYAEANA
jgi:hypothetical protein